MEDAFRCFFSFCCPQQPDSRKQRDAAATLFSRRAYNRGRALDGDAWADSVARHMATLFPKPVTTNQRITRLAVAVLVADQISKWIVLKLLGPNEEYRVIDGFFKFVHWQNTGAAFSMFRHNNGILAVISLAALIALWFFRRHFEIHRIPGQIAIGLLLGGIAGNLIDRVLPPRQHVIDFLYFHLHPRGGGELGFPAFNLADSAICIGVGLLIILSWSSGLTPTPTEGRASETPQT